MAKAQPPASAEGKSRPEVDSSRPLEEEIERQIGQIIPKQQREAVVQRVLQVVRGEYFSGPLPPPRHLEHYDRIVPGSANRIVAMAEKAQSHNIEMEGKIVAAEIADRKLGMWLGFSVLLMLVVLAMWAGMSGHVVLAGLLLSTAVIGSVVAFIKGRNGG